MNTWLKHIAALFTEKKSLKGSLVIAAKVNQKTSRASSGTVPKVRVVFMGTPALSASLLQALVEKDYNIVGVVTKPDKPVGRKKELSQSPVKTFAQDHNLPLLQPAKMDTEAIEAIRAWKPDLIVVAAYGKILPQTLLDIPGFGCINFHTSLLPLWRGASPIQNALLSGATETGVTIMLMDSGMDTGDILTQKSVPIEPSDTTPTLTNKLLTTGTELLLQTLPLWIERQITPTKQDDEQATLCQLIERADGQILWSDDAESISNRYRALYPWPGIFTYYKRDDNLLRLKLLEISYQKQNAQLVHPLGTVFEIGEKIGVQTSSGIIFLETVQLEGKTPTAIREFLNGNEGFLGTLLQ